MHQVTVADTLCLACRAAQSLLPACRVPAVCFCDIAEDNLQVWWYIAGAVGGNLYMHNLATDAVIELEDARREPPVSYMHHDGQGHVWLGHKGGMVRVWSESSLTPVTLPIKCFHAEIRYLACSA